MDDSTQHDLATLATTDARGFLQAFLEASDSDLSDRDVYDIESLKSSTNAEGFHLELVNSKGGSEGGGEYVERVMAVFKKGCKKPVAYLRVTGYYESYSGTESNNDWCFVYPREVKVIQYFEDKE